MLKLGKYRAGLFLYCGERFWSARSWRRYGLLGRDRGIGFNVGPFLFWRSKRDA